MTINDKIKQILIDKNISPSYFADEIGVQRSSISHILSGRNRPSFDIIQKVIRRFPELGYDWIMEEEPEASQQAAPVPTNTSGAYPNYSNYPGRQSAYTEPAARPPAPRGRPAMPPALTEPQLNNYGNGQIARSGFGQPEPQPSWQPATRLPEAMPPVMTPAETVETAPTLPTATGTSAEPIPATSPAGKLAGDKPTDKPIDRIVVFYADGTFREFSPTKE